MRDSRNRNQALQAWWLLAQVGLFLPRLVAYLFGYANLYWLFPLLVLQALLLTLLLAPAIRSPMTIKLSLVFIVECVTEFAFMAWVYFVLAPAL